MSEKLSPTVLDQLHEAMAARIADRQFPGVVTLVAQGDDVQVDTIGETGFGTDVPLRRDAVFRITSMTKPVVAATALTLVDEGVVGLDEPVDRLLPELAGRRVLARIDGPLDETVPARRPITLRDLLTFRMGYGMITEPVFDPRYPIVEAAAEEKLAMSHPVPPTPHDYDEWMRRFGRLPLMAQPGERWLYNTGALVLGVLVARASGQSLEDAVRTRITEPLGMTDTGFVLSTEQADRLPPYFSSDFQGGPAVELPISSPSEWTEPVAFASAAAGLASTADDYLAFGRMLLAGGVYQGTRILSAGSVREMTANQLTPEQVATGGPLLRGRGWGFGVSVALAGDEVWDTPGGYGWDGGFGTTWFNDPGTGVTGVAMSQTSDFLFNGAAEDFWRLAAQAGQ